MSDSLGQTKTQSEQGLHEEDGKTGTQNLRLVLPEQLNAAYTASLWHPWVNQIQRTKATKVVVEAGALEQCDGCGFGLLSYFDRVARENRKSFELRDLKPSLQDLLERHRPDLDHTDRATRVRMGVLTILGQLTCSLVCDVYEQIAFLGHLSVTAFRTLLQPRRFRWREFLRMTELAGANALGIMCLLGFLFGLIMSFSSAMPMAQFGVEIYVVDLVAFALTRVLGPFVTSILLAGRTGSAYAAELGTMKINNELDALEVMNLKPMNFLILPRVMATVVMAPMLTIATDLVGILGCAFVVLSMGYSLSTFWDHVQDILTVTDLWIGLIKAFVYGGIVGAVGCLRGLQTGNGAGAVGISTTRAVVTSIVLLVMAEGIFSVILYVMEL